MNEIEKWVSEIHEIANWVSIFTSAGAEPTSFHKIVEEILGLGHGFLRLLEQPKPHK